MKTPVGVVVLCDQGLAIGAIERSVAQLGLSIAGVVESVASAEKALGNAKPDVAVVFCAGPQRGEAMAGVARRFGVPVVRVVTDRQDTGQQTATAAESSAKRARAGHADDGDGAKTSTESGPDEPGPLGPENRDIRCVASGNELALAIDLAVTRSALARIRRERITRKHAERESSRHNQELARQNEELARRLKVLERRSEQREHRNQFQEQRIAQLESNNRELEVFNFSVAHELLQPIRSISGFSSILVKQYGSSLDDRGKGYLHRTVKAGQRMKEIVNALLNLTRDTQGEVHIYTCNVTAMAEEAVRKLREIDPDRQVEVQIQRHMGTYADNKLLRVVVENLLDNAWKFTANVAGARIEVGETQRDDKQAFFVQDNGAGFDMAYIEDVFAPFKRLHREEEFGGTGIGLTTVKRIINRHGGTIWAEGAPGKGATITFTLS
ncbi:MAG: ATP-binding protein [Proteobacteria bacterium]|nr:ATP-binding protein [Pseudomonadota bacterium]